MKQLHNLQYYIDKINRGEKYSLARYGDGELYCMWGRSGRNSNGCYYYPELKRGLLDSMRHEEDPTFIYGLQRVLKDDEKRITEEYPKVQWHDSEIFSEAVATGELYPLIKVLKEHPRVYMVGNSSVAKKTQDIFDWSAYCFVPPSNAFDSKALVMKFCEENNDPERDSIFLFSCGMAANVFIADLHGKINGWLLDLGHIWDPFTGNMSRCDLEGKTLEDINKNLYEKN